MSPPSLPAAALAIVAACVAHAAHAGRLPAPGGEVAVALPPEWTDAFRDAHTGVALLEAGALDPRERLARPGLAGTTHRSRVLSDLAAVDSPATWRLTVAANADAAAVSQALQTCLGSPRGWPGRVLGAADRAPGVSRAGREITLSFPAPVGPLPALLRGCVVSGDATGSFRPHPRDEGLLTATAEGPGGGPVIDGVRVRGPKDPADVVVNAAPEGPRGDELQAPSPDVVLLLQSPQAREVDPLGLVEDQDVGRFLAHLQPDLLAAVFWDGRGARATGILPPGLGPSRPLPRGEAPIDPPPLTMAALGPDAPAIALHRGDDTLGAAAGERLVAILRARGVRVDDEADVALSILRWRPPTMEPALALLELAAARREVFGALAPAVVDALLPPDPAPGAAAAADLEGVWLRERRVVPLFTAERWISVSPRVRGVRLRPDGVPLLHDAYITGPR